MECVIGCGAGGAITLLLAVSVVMWLQSTFVAIFLMWPFLIIFGFIAGAGLGTLAAIIVLPVNASLGWPLKALWLSFVVGGLSGFLPFLLLLTVLNNLSDSELMFAAAVGPLPHMVLGHLCAYWMTAKVVNDHNERFGVVKYEVAQAGIRSSRFGITHILILTIWAALGFSLLSCATPEFGLRLAISYLTLQTLSALVAMIVIGSVSFVRRYRKGAVSR